LKVKQLIAKLARVNPDREVILAIVDPDDDLDYHDDLLDIHEVVDIEEFVLDGKKVIRLVCE